MTFLALTLKILLISKLYFNNKIEKQKTWMKTTATFKAYAACSAVLANAKVLDWAEQEKVQGLVCHQPALCS